MAIFMRPRVSKTRTPDRQSEASVRIDGWLVEAKAGDGWHWRSSLTRKDTGAGACEVIFVRELQVL